MKKILAFLAMASLASLAHAADLATATAVASGETVINTGTATHTCAQLSTTEPAVTINLSRDVLAALHCNATTNAIGAATGHPGGRTNACNSGAARCVYAATTAGGPVTALPGPATVIAPTTCASTISDFTGGTAPTVCAP